MKRQSSAPAPGDLTVSEASWVELTTVASMVCLSRMTWSVSLVSMGLFLGAMLFSRIELAAASWAWHSTKTGQAFTWCLIRTRS